MNFADPLPLTEILTRFDAKTPIGSILRSAMWQAMPQGLRDSAFFSAGVTDAAFLASQQQSIREMIARAKATNENGETYWKMDRARFVRDLRVMGESIGLKHPDGKRQGSVNEKDITDPISIARLKLVVNTQLEMAYGEGQWRTGMDETLLNEWPAWELVRISPRKMPRDWPERWKAAADACGWEGVSRKAFETGLMIALKTSRVWILLSRFQRPHPPFDFNSGMGVEEKGRDEVEALGDLVAPQEVLKPNVSDFENTLEASIKGIPDVLRQSLQKVFGKQIQMTGDTARWVPVTQQKAPVPADLAKPIETKIKPQTKAKPAPAPAAKVPKKSKEEIALEFGKEFGCRVSFDAPGGKARRWGKRMSNPEAIRHLQTIAEEWRRMRESFPALKRDGITNTFLCLDSRRGRAHMDGPAPYLVTKVREWTAENFAQIKQWEEIHKRSWGTERQGFQVQDNFRHEMAHNLSTPQVLDAFKPVKAKYNLEWFRQNVSEYAASEDAEAIAEAFGICTRADYVQGTLPLELEKFIFETMLGGTL